MPAPVGHEPYNINGEGGRPNKYDERYLDALADEFIEWYKKPDNIWFFRFFCETKWLAKSTVYTFKGRSKKFDDAFEAAKDIQEGKIADGALKRKYSEKMSLSTLAVNHGWKLSENKNIKIEATPEAFKIFESISPSDKLVDE